MKSNDKNNSRIKAGTPVNSQTFFLLASILLMTDLSFSEQQSQVFQCLKVKM